MFLGTFTPKLLSNDQIALPAKIRSKLDSNQAVLTTGFETCIYGFSVQEWEKLAEIELQKPLSSEEGRRVRRQFFASAEVVDLDGQGRFVLPNFLKNYAELTSDLIIVGVGDHFEIWNNDEWQTITSQSS